MVDRTELAYACWRVLAKCKGADGETIDGLRFNKLMSLLNKELMDEGLDLNLPRCWYFFGEMVVARELPQQVRFEGFDEEERRSAFTWSGKSPEGPGKRAKQRIDSKVDSLFSRFPPTEDISKLVNEVYGYAPYEFQRAYGRFRSDFSFESLADPDGSLRAKTFYKDDFEKAMECFPTEDFPELKVSWKKVEYVVNAVFEEQPHESSVGIELAKRFWEIFCMFLRGSDKGHSNVRRDRVEYWRKKAFEDLQEYRSDLDHRISAILNSYELPTLSDPLLLSFLQPEDFGPSLKHLASSVDKTVYG